MIVVHHRDQTPTVLSRRGQQIAQIKTIRVAAASISLYSRYHHCYYLFLVQLQEVVFFVAFLDLDHVGVEFDLERVEDHVRCIVGQALALVGEIGRALESTQSTHLHFFALQTQSFLMDRNFANDQVLVLEAWITDGVVPDEP
jgi:hypothetical protein